MLDMSLKEIQDITVEAIMQDKQVVALLDYVYSGMIEEAKKGFAVYTYFRQEGDLSESLIKVATILRQKGCTTNYSICSEFLAVRW